MPHPAASDNLTLLASPDDLPLEQAPPLDVTANSTADADPEARGAATDPPELVGPALALMAEAKAETAAETPSPFAATTASRPRQRVPQALWHDWFGLRAASILVVLGVAIAGALLLGGSHGDRTAAIDPATPDPTTALRGSISQLAAEISGLKAAIATTQATTQQGIARLDARLAASEARASDLSGRVAGIAKQLATKSASASAAPAATRSATPAATAPDVTGSIVSADAPVATGWVLWRVRNGRALVHGNGGYFEVVPGSTLPGLGLVHRIARDGNGWIVVTESGIIVPPRG